MRYSTISKEKKERFEDQFYKSIRKASQPYAWCGVMGHDEWALIVDRMCNKLRTLEKSKTGIKERKTRN